MTTGMIMSMIVAVATDSVPQVFQEDGNFADLEDLVVTATRTPKSLKDVPVVTRLISRDEYGRLTRQTYRIFSPKNCRVSNSDMP